MIDNWTCHVCGENRPERFVSVHKRDNSEKYSMSPGTFVENIRYCNDKHKCIKGSRTHSNFTKESAQEKVKENSENIDEYSKSMRKMGEKKEKYNAMRYFYTFLIFFAAAMIINPLLGVALQDDVTFMEKLLWVPGIFMRVLIGVYFSWRYTDKLFPNK